MLIDLTRRPVMIQPDECPSMLLVRSISAGGVAGTVLKDPSSTPGFKTNKNLIEISPLEQFQRCSALYLETKLDILEAKSISPIASVFEAASVLAHTVTQDPVQAWRVRISVLYKESKIWQITLWDLTKDRTPLITLSTRDLDPMSLHIGQVPPLTRAKRVISSSSSTPLNAWSRLLLDDDI